MLSNPKDADDVKPHARLGSIHASPRHLGAQGGQERAGAHAAGDRRGNPVILAADQNQFVLAAGGVRSIRRGLGVVESGP